MDFKENLDFAGMTDVGSGMIKGSISEDFEIWVPSKTVGSSFVNQPFESVTLEGKGSKEEIIFFVPKRWVYKNAPDGPTKLKEIYWTKKENTSKLLNEFVSLANANGDRYLAFAKKWGPLWERKSENKPVISNLIPDKCLVAPWIESVEIWRGYVRITKSLLEIAAYLINDKLAPEKVWLELGSDYKGSHSLSEQRFMFTFYINMHLCNEYDVRYSLDWSKDTPEIKFQSRLGFINALWFQFMQAVTLQNLFICNGCGRAYSRDKRKPKLKQNNYCISCGNSAAKRDWYHRNKEKVKEQRRLKKESLLQKKILL